MAEDNTIKKPEKKKRTSYPTAEERKLQSPRDKRSKYTNEQIAELFKKKGCNISSTCSAIGISRMTFNRWRDDDPELERMIQEANEAVVDFAESKLVEQINGGNITAIIFFLKTKGKRRGYIESNEVVANVSGIELRPLTDEELDELIQLNK